MKKYEDFCTFMRDLGFDEVAQLDVSNIQLLPEVREIAQPTGAALITKNGAARQPAARWKNAGSGYLSMKPLSSCLPSPNWKIPLILKKCRKAHAITASYFKRPWNCCVSRKWNFCRWVRVDVRDVKPAHTRTHPVAFLKS